MIKAPPSNLQPLTSEESRIVAHEVLAALELMPRHRHNKRGNPEDCDNCSVVKHLIKAFKVFKRFGE